jgi:serine/threonine protein kinase
MLAINKAEIILKKMNLENILIDLRNKDCVPKITGYNPFQSNDDFDVESEDFKEILAFVSPELLDGVIFSYKCDIWSLGIILFVMIFHNYPFGSSLNVKK